VTVPLLAGLADLLHKTGLAEQAEPLYQKVLRLQPDSASAHLGLAEIDHALGRREAFIGERLTHRANLGRSVSAGLQHRRVL